MPLKLRAPVEASARVAFTFDTSPPPVDAADAVAAVGTTKAFHPRPPGDFLPERDMHMYGAQPLVDNEPGRAIVRCSRCGRSVLEWAAADHRRICSHILDGAPLQVKKGLKTDKKGKEEIGKKRRASDVSRSDSPDASPSKKRAKILESLGSDDEIDPNAYKGLKKNEIKKLLKEKERLRKREAKERERQAIAERKRQRALNPLDYDRQCGVINDKGLPCSRSLTCKTHTVGAKRAVQGRTRPYDELYIEWQRAHNPNFKEPQTKKDKEAAKAAAAAAAAANGATAAERKAAAAKKRRQALDEDGLRFDEDGHREMEELIRATKICGDRVRSVSNSLGHGFVAASQSPPNGSTPTASKPAAAAAASSSKPAANGSSSVPAKPSPLASVSPAPIPAPHFFPVPSVWHRTTYEQMSMGDLLTKALAARPRPQSNSHGHGHGHHAPGSARTSISGPSKPGPNVVPPMVQHTVTPATGVTA